MSAPRGTEWDGRFRDGRLEVRLTPAEVVARLEKMTETHWLDGGPLFSPAAYAARFAGDDFSIWNHSGRGGRIPRLEGTIAATPDGSAIRYEVKTARWLVFVFPVLAIVPVSVLAGIAIAQGDATPACVAGIWTLLVSLMGLVVFLMHRTAAVGLHRFFRELFSDDLVREARAAE
jgi:hypothetical protein